MKEKRNAALLVEREDGMDLFLDPDSAVLNREELIERIRGLGEGQRLSIRVEVETDAGK